MPKVLTVKSPLLKNLIQFVAINGFVPDGPNYIPVMPDGVSSLVINIGSAYERVQSQIGGKKIIKGSHFVGIKSKYCYVKPNNGMRTISIRFKPGAVPFFIKSNLHEITDNVIAADELFGRDIFFLEELIAEENDPDTILEHIELFLLGRLNINYSPEKITEKIKMIYRDPSHCKIEDLRSGNTSYKKLEREFMQHIGIAPKLFIDIVRFNYATSLLFKNPGNAFTCAGYQAGYYDQSHFINSFKKFSGFTPGKYIQQRSDMFLDNQRIIGEEF